MNDELFSSTLTAMDATIDAWIGKLSGITVGFALAHELYRRELLETIDHDIEGVRWRHRRYRGRIVQPDAELGENDFYFGMRIG